MKFQILSENQLDQLGRTLFETRRGLLTLDEVREWLELSEIVKLFNTWAVTEHGMECMVEYYPIDAKRLRENWIDHLTEKKWMTAAMLGDLTRALAYAKDHFHIGGRSGKIDRAVRFAIFKRDGYRCQICGRSAQQGMVLEIDHKLPRAKGGTDDRSNLWTLCFDCNRGKRDSDL